MTFTGVFLVLWFTLLALYSLYACFFMPYEQTVSYTLYSWACTNPILAGIIGAVVAHWFWPQRMK